MSSKASDQSRLTVSLPARDVQYVIMMAKRTGKSKSGILQEALYLLKRAEIDRDFREGAIANAEMDLKMAEEDMGSFWEVVTKYPHGC